MRDMEAGQSSHTVGLLTRADSASARGRDQPQHHDNPPEPVPSRQKPHVMDCFDYFCRMLNVTTAVTALLCLVANGMALWLYSPAKGLPDVLEQAMRVYAILGALLIVLIELELERLLWLFRFAEYWIGRAQVQIFIALLTFKMATSEGRSCNPDMPDRSCDFNKSLELYRFAAAVALLGCGGVYLLGGVLCFGLLKRATLSLMLLAARSNRERMRSQAEADLAELEKKREELHGLLGRSD